MRRQAPGGGDHHRHPRRALRGEAAHRPGVLVRARVRVVRREVGCHLTPLRPAQAGHQRRVQVRHRQPEGARR